MSREDGHGYLPPLVKRARCKRCGSGAVAWVQSKKTGRFYLAFASARQIYPQTPHRCDDPTAGGFRPGEAPIGPNAAA